MSAGNVQLEDGAFYWIKHAYKPETGWTVARWQHGSFWDSDGREATPSAISGPIIPPADPA